MVIPSKAQKMAKIVVRQGLSQLAGLQEMYNSLDRDLMVKQLADMFAPRTEEFVDSIMEEEYPRLWLNLPLTLRQQIYKSIEKQLPKVFSEIVAEFGEHIEDYVDLEEMVSSQLMSNKQLLNDIFLGAGGAEFKFIIQSGFYFGALFGLVQMIVWIFLPEWWILP